MVKTVSSTSNNYLWVLGIVAIVAVVAIVSLLITRTSISDSTIETDTEGGDESALAGQAIWSSRPVKVARCDRTGIGINVTRSVNGAIQYNQYKNGCEDQDLRTYSCVDSKGRTTARGTAYVTRTDDCDGNGCVNGKCIR